MVELRRADRLLWGLCLFSLAVALAAAFYMMAGRTPPARALPSVRLSPDPAGGAMAAGTGPVGSAAVPDPRASKGSATPTSADSAPTALIPTPPKDPTVRAWRKAVVTRDRNAITSMSLALLNRGREETLPDLLQLAQEDPDERVRAFAMRTLGRMRDPAFRDRFLGLLKDDRSEFVRENAAWSLGELHAAEAAGALESAGANDASPRVREAAQAALVELRAAKAADAPGDGGGEGDGR